MIILPWSVGASSVLITLMQEVLLIGLGVVVTAHLYDVVVKNRIRQGGLITMSRRRSIVDFLPMNSDLPYQGGTEFEKFVVTIARLIIFTATILIGFSMDTVEVHEPDGFADHQMKIITSFQPRQIDHTKDYVATVKEMCEVIDADTIRYSAALYRTKDHAVFCGEGWQGKRREIVKLRWNNVVKPADAKPKIVRYGDEDGNQYQDSKRICQHENECKHWIQFFEKDGRVFLEKIGAENWIHSQNGTVEIVEPKDFFVVTAYQVVGDIYTGVTPPLALARSFSNHIMYEEEVNVELPSKSAVFKGALKLYGFVIGVVTLSFILIAEIATQLMRRRLPFPCISFTSHIFVASMAMDGVWSGSRPDIGVVLNESEGTPRVNVLRDGKRLYCDRNGDDSLWEDS